MNLNHQITSAVVLEAALLVLSAQSPARAQQIPAAAASAEAPRPASLSPLVGLPPVRRNQAPTGLVPRTADGKPDLSAPWEPNALPQNVDLVKTGVQPTFQPWAEKLYKEHKETNSKDDPEARCLPPGVPRVHTTPYPFRILQTPGLVVIVYEGGAHLWRQIFTDGRPHSPDPDPTWLGESIGHWEGDTLVVDTVGFNGKTWIDQSGLPTTDKLHVIERFHRIDLGHLEIENTIDDPGAYTRPWKFTTHPVLLKGDLMEYICQENEKDVQHLVGR